jgi:hypothetical protein
MAYVEGRISNCRLLLAIGQRDIDTAGFYYTFSYTSYPSITELLYISDTEYWLHSLRKKYCSFTWILILICKDHQLDCGTAWFSG